MNTHDTICALATGHGGAISVIRISGEHSLEIVSEIFKSKNLGKSISTQKSHTLTFGEIIDNDEVIDEVLVSVFRSPNSYTGENSVEISTHASTYIVQKILQLLIEKGARNAQPGEFTQRAFLNGKMDLAQAEAVADLIASDTAAAHRVAMQQMRGGFSSELSDLRARLLTFISLIELELDFSEEDVEFADRAELRRLISEILSHLDALLKSFALGNVLKNGVPVAIIGKPNVGKSTLLNALLNEERAIVSDIPGTTRDTLEDVMTIEGYQFRFIDTAGIRQTDDRIENLGIERTFQKIEKAELVLLLMDAQNSDYVSNYREIKEKYPHKNMIPIVNKSDLLGRVNPIRTTADGTPILYISAKHKHSLNKLHEVLLNFVESKNAHSNNVIISNTRHYEALTRAREAALRVADGLQTGISGDLLAQDIRDILHHIGEITGQTFTPDEVLGNIFKNFCIGK